MMKRLRRAHDYFRSNGIRSTANKIAKNTWQYAVNTPQRLKYRDFVRQLPFRDAGEIFSEIYERNLWESKESRSGIGSELVATKNVRDHLPIIFEKFEIVNIFDAPCGDFNWMRLVPLHPNMAYIGWDIVPAIIEANKAKSEDAQHRFAVGNILLDPLPSADIMICRDCLFHFSNADILLALENFLKSKIKFFLSTSHTALDESTNTDIPTGYFRRIDLFSEPFCFPRNVLYSVDDFAPNHVGRQMHMWNRVQVARAVIGLRKFCNQPVQYEPA